MGQEHVARTLANAIATGRIAHAFILTVSSSIVQVEEHTGDAVGRNSCGAQIAAVGSAGVHHGQNR